MNKYLENTLRERKLSSDSNASLSPLQKQGQYQKNKATVFWLSKKNIDFVVSFSSLVSLAIFYIRTYNFEIK